MNRRDLLKGVAVTGSTAALDLKAGNVALSPEPRKLKFVVTGGHPGDPEYGCGGTIARLTSLGHEVALLYMNDGAWQETSATTRIAEAKKACEILKARPLYARQINGHAIIDNQHYKDFQTLLEAEKPDAVFTHWPIDNHPDHRGVANLTYEAWKQMKHFFALYYYEVSDGEDTSQFPAPTHYVDITDLAETKRAACYAHASQTPDFYYPLQDTVAAFRGFQAASKRAEGYVMQIGSADVFAQAGLQTRLK